MKEVKETRAGSERCGKTDLKGLRSSLSLCLCLSVISGWNEAGCWLDSSVHRFKFRLDQTWRLGPRSQPANEELVEVPLPTALPSPRRLTSCWERYDHPTLNLTGCMKNKPRELKSSIHKSVHWCYNAIVPTSKSKTLASCMYSTLKFHLVENSGSFFIVIVFTLTTIKTKFLKRNERLTLNLRQWS